MKALLIAAVLGALTVSSFAEDIEVKNMTGREYQKRFTELTQRGYRPIKVWAKTLGVFDYQPGEGPQFGYWATFRKVPNGPAWASFHGLDAAAYQREFDRLSRQGFVPTDINVACVNNDVRYCVVYDKIPNAPAGIARHNLNRAAFDKANTEALAKGFKRKITTSCAAGGGTVFAAYWQK